MNILILKLNATGDVVRTTPLLRRLRGAITWITAAGNLTLLEGLTSTLRCIDWEDRRAAQDTFYDLVINLEDETAAASFVRDVPHERLFGAYMDGKGTVSYTQDSRSWFDLSLISTFGRKRADELKLMNRRTYQELIFESLGFSFAAEPYVMPRVVPTSLRGDVAIAPVAGPVWPNKNWAYYRQLKERLEADGLVVNMLPRRAALVEHLSDVQNHRCLVGGDSLPMHFALGTGTPCVTIFNCTSPWEIYDYGVQSKIVSPLLEKFFYRRDYNQVATTAVEMDEVYDAVIDRLRHSANPLLVHQPS